MQLDTSSKAAADHIAALKRKGYLADDSEGGRGLRLTEKAIGIPVLGDIPAGSPVDVEERVEFSLPINTRPFGVSDRNSAFFLRVRGDSMIGRHIFDGDLVLVEKSNRFKNRDVVAALIDNESTLKTFIRDAGQTWLKSENPKYPNLIPALDLQVQGVARSVIRLFPS
ncbi:MAG TPA: transcriptional repressor LexA [Chthoniobacterales bacterium]